MVKDMKSAIKYSITGIIIIAISYGLIALLPVTVAAVLNSKTAVLIAAASTIIIYLKWRKSLRLQKTFIPIQFIDA
jgi:hypothetical protein